MSVVRLTSAVRTWHASHATLTLGYADRPDAVSTSDSRVQGLTAVLVMRWEGDKNWRVVPWMGKAAGAHKAAAKYLRAGAQRPAAEEAFALEVVDA